MSYISLKFTIISRLKAITSFSSFSLKDPIFSFPRALGSLAGDKILKDNELLVQVQRSKHWKVPEWNEERVFFQAICNFIGNPGDSQGVDFIY